MYSLIIKNAKILDGTGKPSVEGDVAIEGDKIVNIDTAIPVKAQATLDIQGKFLAPGFIDIQNHSDVYWQLFDNPGLDSLVSQGYTTVLIGNCGASLAPLLSHDALLSVQKWHSLEGVNIDWQSFSGYLEVLAKQKFGCNIASLIGYSTLRRGIVGDQVRALEKEEEAAITRVLEESLDSGAFGLSSGLSYSHEVIVSEMELFKMAKSLKGKNALLSLHLRSEGNELVEALSEAMDIARQTEVSLKISHFKVRGKENWHKLPQALEMLETAFHKGMDVHFDLYPYDTVWQTLYSYLPRWSIEGGRSLMLRQLADPVQRNKILAYLNNSTVDFGDLQVASTTNNLNFIGKKVSQIAKNLESTSEEAVLHLVQNGGSEVLVFEKNLDPAQVESLLLHPLSFVGTDGGGFNTKSQNRFVHPRCFGTAEKYLCDTAKSNKIPWHEAIIKLTSGPAQKMGLKNRGEIKIGNYADLVVFDPEKLKDCATYDNPYQFSEGIEYVFVNGKAVLSEGLLTGVKSGSTLRKD